MPTSTITSGFSINTADLQRLTRDLQRTVPGIRKSLNVAIKSGAAIVAAEAAALSSWSTRIPNTVRVGGTSLRVVVKAGGRKAPHAAAFENRGVAGSFRHPVFGNREVWVSQQARPFLAPALAHKSDEVVKAVSTGIDIVFHESGFH